MPTDVSTPLPEMILPPGSTITVTFDDPATNVTKLNVFGFTPAPTDEITPERFVPQFVYTNV